MKNKGPQKKPYVRVYRNPFAANDELFTPRSLQEAPAVKTPRNKTERIAEQKADRLTNPKPARRPKVKKVQDTKVHNENTPGVFSAEFMLGATRIQETPKDKLPQVAFFGRSNVGKSSLLATLMGRKGMVKISAAPGKTREINFFKINGTFYFVDLPGIGYAKVSIAMRDEMAERIKEFVEKSKALKGIVYLVDMRVAGTPLDIETVETLRSLGKPILLVGSKRDKLNQSQASQALLTMQERFGLDEPPLAISSHSRQGLDELWIQITEAVNDRGEALGED